MSFRAHEKLRSFTKGFESGDYKSSIFKTDFSTWYFSFLVGVANSEREKNLSDTNEIMQKFPEGFSKSKKQIIGILITTYLKDSGMELENKKDLKKMIQDLINIETGELSKEGFKRANEYAYAGFELIYKNNRFAANPAETLKSIIKLINK